MLGDLAGARALCEKVLEVRSRTLPDDHPDLQDARETLAWTIAHELAQAPGTADGWEATSRQRQRERERCAELALALCRAQTAAARLALLGGSPRETEERCGKLSERLDVSLSFAGGYGVLEPMGELVRASFELSETTRGAALSSAALMRAAAGAPEYREAREGLCRLSEELSSLVQEGTTSGEFQEALARRDAAQRELVVLARGAGGTAGLAFDVDLLQASLSAGEVVVAYRRYRRWSLETRGTDPSKAQAPVPSSADRLCAFTLRSARRSAPGRKNEAARAEDRETPLALAFFDLGPLEPIEKAVRAWRASLGAGAEGRGMGVVETRAVAGGVEEQGRALRRLALDPLRNVLEGADRVIFALDDVLHLVPLDALPAEEAGSDPEEIECLGDRLRIETRVTLTELLDPRRASEGRGELVVVGGVAYGGEGANGGSAAEDGILTRAEGSASGNARHDEEAGILRGGAWSVGFTDLPATVAEARSIAGEFAEQQGTDAAVTLLQGGEATRERLFEAAPRARWLHVATHGWFAPESIRSWEDRDPLDELTGLGMRATGEEQVRGMSPMLLCGLALAGANQPEDELGRVPGLVTAEEIAALDLSDCELAVLSACDTNVGERRSGQGVASLQRALQMAGARSVVTSLWKVPDEATRELMVDFYRRIWVEGKPKHQALWEAKRRLREAKDESGRPRYALRDWAAWVLTGDPR
jgi:CHAT domain-containing protein